MSEETNQQQQDEQKKPSSIVLATAEPRFLQRNMPSWVTYWATFLSFPLNAMGAGWSFIGYGVFFSENIYLKTFCISYMAWIGLIDHKRCDGIGYPDTPFFNTLRRWVRNNWFYAATCAYYPVRLHKLAELPATTTTTTKDGSKNETKKAKYLFACHPHGVLGIGSMSVFGTDEVGFSKLFPGIEVHLMGLRPIFFTPFFRDICLLGGCYSSDKSSFRHLFETRQESVAINLGGAAEGFIGLGTNPTTGNTVMKLLLNERKGFCKMALQYGVSLVPVIAFEEHLLFDLIRLPTSGGTWVYNMQLYLQKYVTGFAPLIVWGNMYPFMPKRHPLNVFVGAPIPCEQFDNPNKEQIDAKHKEYCVALEKMFHECKKLVPGCEDWELEFVDHPFKSIK